MLVLAIAYLVKFWIVPNWYVQNDFGGYNSRAAAALIFGILFMVDMINCLSKGPSIMGLIAKAINKFNKLIDNNLEF